MSNNDFLVGDVVRVTVSITDIAGIAVDPAVVRLKVRKPDGALQTHLVGDGIVRDAVGSYHAEILLDGAGTWIYRWEGDAPNAGAGEGALIVRKSRVI